MDYNKKGYKIALIALVFALIALSSSGLNGTNGTNGTSSILGTLTFSLHNISSDVTEYSSLKMDSVIVADVNKTSRTFTTIPNGQTLLQNWTSLPMGLKLIPTGAVLVHIHAKKIGSGGSHDDILNYDIGIVNSTGGGFSSIGVSGITTDLLSTDEHEFDIDGVMLERVVNTTDRMALRLYVNQTGTGVLPGIVIYMDDLTVSRLTVPAIPIDLTSLINDVGNNTANMDLKVNKSGDRWTGKMSGYDFTVNPFWDADLNIQNGYFDANVFNSSSTAISAFVMVPDDIGFIMSDDFGGSNYVNVSMTQTDFGNDISLTGHDILNSPTIDAKVNKTGDVMTGLLNLTHGGSPLTFLTGINTATSASSAGAGLLWGSDDGNALATGDRLGFFVFQGAQDSAHTLGNPISIQAIANSSFTSTNIESYLSFSIAPKNSTSRTEMFRFEPSGNMRMFVNGKGITMDSPNGASWCTTVNNTGVLITASGACS